MGSFTSISLTFLNKISDQNDRITAASDFDGSSETELYCSICLNDICGGDGCRKLPECGHTFHSRCIDVWLQSHSTCPLCRAQLPQIISLNRSQYEWKDVVSTLLALINDFLHKMCNPLNDELSSMLCANI
ncbi:RING-H2 finger protein ATL7-like [Salvia hispanica]|uniref:RING-H2 finger protein ATL7-like n=1 Tax=Salvia hispanica TaxID=49212 RepID=UPI0020098AD1|nr:RING-H2 finger protein ATL7-like [Salvia hispanica]XP_047979224.1 RING-H2 finger protein ATL7-like [Salvia hispanica]